MVASRVGHLAVVEYLVEMGADVNARDKFGNSVLLIATREGHHKIAEILRANGATT